MLKQFGQVLVKYLNIHRRWLVPVFIFPILWSFILGLFPPDQPLSADRGLLPQDLFFLVKMLPLSLTQLLLAFGLALTFKRKGSENWFSRIPISDFSFIFIPYFLLLFYGVFAFLLGPKKWEFVRELTGMPLLFTLGLMPVFTFVTVKSIRNTLMSLFSGFIGIISIAALADFLWRLLGSNPKGETVATQFIIMPGLEALCAGLILLSVLYFEKKKRERSLVLGFGISSSLVACGMFLVNFQIEKRKLSDYFSPLDRLAVEFDGIQSQCNEFKRYYERNIGDSSSTEALKNREVFLGTIAALRNYPILNFPNRSQYLKDFPNDLAQGLFVNKTMALRECNIINLYDLERSIIETFSTKSFPISNEEVKAATTEILANIKKTTDAPSSLIQIAINTGLLNLLSERKAIDPSYRRDILELAAGFERERRSLAKIEPTLWGIRAPSKERVRMMLQSLQRELHMTMDQRERLVRLIAKIG